MAVQIYLVHLSQDHQRDDQASAALADLTSQVGGFVLMATNAGSLILAFDEQWLPLFRQHRAVEFCGAVRVDPSGAAAERLRNLFASNVAKQLAGRSLATDAAYAADATDAAGATGAAGAAGATGAAARHRPLQWHLPQASEPASGSSFGTQRRARGGR